MSVTITDNGDLVVINEEILNLTISNLSDDLSLTVLSDLLSITDQSDNLEIIEQVDMITIMDSSSSGSNSSNSYFPSGW